MTLDTLVTLKNFPKKFLKKVIFEQCHSAEKCKRGTLWDFLTSIVLRNIERNEGGPFGAIQKNSKKKSHSAEKSGAKVGSIVCFRGSGRVLFSLFVLDALLRFECFEPP